MDAKARHDDEAGRIRRWSPGPSQQAHEGGANANSTASITGGFWLALIAIVAVGVLWSQVSALEHTVRDMAAAAAVSADRADDAERSAKLAEAFAVQIYPQVNARLSEYGIPGVKTPLEDHDPNLPSAQKAFTDFVEHQ